MTTPTPTPEQTDILAATVDTQANLMINALAGTGKSATLKMIDQVCKTRPALYLVFNRRNADEAIAAQKAGDFASTTSIRTFNSLGHRIWATVVPKLNLDKRKTGTLFRAHIDGWSRADAADAWTAWPIIQDGIEKAKAHGYVPADTPQFSRTLISRDDLHHRMDEPPDEFAADLLDTLLIESIKKAFSGHIDFNDQIYMPTLFGGTFPKFPRVMVDEYQDQSPVNHAMLQKLVTGRLIGVGDPNQNIYGFRGAMAGGMSKAIDHYSMTTLPLSTSFRCPSAIVSHVHWHVPTFRAANLGGSVHVPTTFAGNSFPDDATIICRNNAPLLRLAFKLLSAGRSVNVMGSDLGPRLIGIMKKLGDTSLTRGQTLVLIEEWREARLLAGSKSAEDMADCMRVFAEHGDTLGSAISYAEHIFAQFGTIRLLTGHKSKGLEFHDVYHLDPWLCDRKRDQDANLEYVISTRSLANLTEIASKAITWDS